MRPKPSGLSSALRRVGAVTAALCVIGTTAPLTSAPAVADPASPPSLPVSDAFRPTADIGFHDLTRDGSERQIRDDLDGELGGMVEFVQATASNPTGNAEIVHPDVVADRVALLLFTPTSEITGASVEVTVDGESVGTLELDAPNLLPASDQAYDERGTVAYSKRAWSAQLPAEWVQPGLALTVTDAEERSGSLEQIDIAAPDELVINNIRLGMLTDAPESDDHGFIVDPVGYGTDYFQTIPVAKMTVAQYETVELDEVIVGSGEIYTVEGGGAPDEGGVYGGSMREYVGKAQVSTGINLATWGITSSPMSQQQPGHTNQRVIHHSAGLYSNGVHKHGLSGGNGMATLYSSIGNELSHELGHSYGIGHYPGTDQSASGDDVIRNAVHHMDSGWGYIAHRNLMRSNLSLKAFEEAPSINGHVFTENLAGSYNFNTDAMSGGWDASPVSDYTHHTAHSLTTIQKTLKDLVADTSYPSGYRSWDEEKGEWADAAALDPEFALPAPAQVGVPVFTILGGYNPADADQTLVYPAFRSNYGVTFDLPQADTASTAAERTCWLEVGFEDAETQHIALDASDGVKQLNVNIAESAAPTGAQIMCRTGEETTALGNQIEIATGLEPMDAPAVIGGEEGFEQLRAQELGELEAVLLEQSDSDAPVLGVADLQALQGWSDDLSPLSAPAREVAEEILQLTQDASDIETYLNEHVTDGVADSEQSMGVLAGFLDSRGHLGADGQIFPAGSAVTVEDHCLEHDGAALSVAPERDGCSPADSGEEQRWFADLLGRIHPAEQPELCASAATPVVLRACSQTDTAQRWIIQENGQVLQASNPNRAMDYHRASGYPGLYGATGTSNQLWSTFAISSTPLLAYLSSDALAALHAVGELPEPVIMPEEEAPAEDEDEDAAVDTPAPTPEEEDDSTEAPGEETPVEDEDSAEAPEEETPAEDEDAAVDTPAQTPEEEDSTEAPEGEAPTEEDDSTEEAPAEAPEEDTSSEAPGAEAPTEDDGAGEGTPAEETPAAEEGTNEEAPAETPAGGAPAEEIPVEEAPAEDTPAGDADSAEDTTVGTPGQEAPVEGEAPSDWTPADEEQAAVNVPIEVPEQGTGAGTWQEAASAEGAEAPAEAQVEGSENAENAEGSADTEASEDSEASGESEDSAPLAKTGVSVLVPALLAAAMIAGGVALSVRNRRTGR